MRRVHPLWRGFFLACALTAALVLAGGPDSTAAFRGERAPLLFAGMTALGGALAALPGWLSRRNQHLTLPRWPRCLLCFFCGAAMLLSLGTAGSGRMLFSLYEGSTGAYAFTGAAMVTGFVTARIAGRRDAA